MHSSPSSAHKLGYPGRSCAAMPPLPGPATDSRRDSSARCHPKNPRVARSALPRPTSGARRCCRYDPLRMGLKTGVNRSKKPTPGSCAFNPLLSGIRTSAGSNIASARVEVYIRPPTLTFSAHQNRSKNSLLCWPPPLIPLMRISALLTSIDKNRSAHRRCSIRRTSTRSSR